MYVSRLTMMTMRYLTEQPRAVLGDGQLGVAGRGQVRLQLQHRCPLGLCPLGFCRRAAVPLDAGLAVADNTFNAKLYFRFVLKIVQCKSTNKIDMFIRNNTKIYMIRG